MSDRYTTITLGANGFSLHGRTDVSTAISAIRRAASADLANAQAVLNASDDDFRIYTHTGIHRVRNIEVLQEGKSDE